MKKNLSAISLIVLSLVTACASPINNSKTLPDNHINSKHNLNTTISGKTEFPSSDKKLSIKATLTEIGVNATVSVIYPSEHPSFANKTIATGLTDTNGNFSINPDVNFTPTLNEIFVLEASKRIGSTGKAVITVRTFIKWNGNTWDSITSPSLNINTKTTALASMIELLSPSVNANDSIGKILVSENISTPSDIKHLDIGNTIIKADSINKVANLLLEYTLANNQDPLEYLVYQNGQFTLKEPDLIVNKITTFVGNGGNTFIGDNELATNSILNTPSGIAFDTNDNIYIVDSNNNRIRKVDKLIGVISTIAGTNFAGYNGAGEANKSFLYLPKSIISDSNGNISFSDTNNNIIRKIEQNIGVISTIVGTGASSYYGDGGQAKSSNLYIPRGLAIDNLSNMYIADSGNNRIRKVDKLTGIITTIIGTGISGYSSDGIQASLAKINNPNSIIFDSNGNLYFSDSNNHRIRKVDKLTGIITTITGNGIQGYSGDGGQATNSTLNSLSGIAFDSNENLYFSDSNNHRIRKVDKLTGIITTIIGTGISGYSSDGIQASLAKINNPNSIIFDSNGNLYFSDSNNHRIRKVDKLTGIITTIAGGGTGDNVKATNAILSSTASTILVDINDNLYIQNTNKKIDAITGIISTVSNTNNAQQKVVDSNGNSYTVDSINNRIRKVDGVTGIITTIAGTGLAGFSGDGGEASNAQLNNPSQITLDSKGNLYIYDSGNKRIRKVELAKTIKP